MKIPEPNLCLQFFNLLSATPCTKQSQLFYYNFNDNIFKTRNKHPFNANSGDSVTISLCISISHIAISR